MEEDIRDGGFEFNYQGQWYFAKYGKVKPFNKSVRGNYLVSELQHDNYFNDVPNTSTWMPVLFP